MHDLLTVVFHRSSSKTETFKTQINKKEEFKINTEKLNSLAYYAQVYGKGYEEKTNDRIRSWSAVTGELNEKN